MRLYGQKLAKETNCETFKGGNHWRDSFMRRCNLSNRRTTGTCYNLSEDWQDKMAQFRKHTSDSISKNNIQDDQIANFDEVSATFDLSGSYTVETKGTKQARVKTASGEKLSFTVNLCAFKDGRKLPPMVIFKRKTIPKLDFPKEVVVYANENRFMNTDSMIFWINNIWAKKRKSICSKSKVFTRVRLCKSTNF